MNVRPLSMGSTLMAPNKSACPRAGKIRYDVRTGKPYPGQFEAGKPKTNTKIKKWSPATPCPWYVAASGKRWWGSSSLPDSETIGVLNSEVAYAPEGYNAGGKSVAVVPPFVQPGPFGAPTTCSSAGGDT
jgi:hypothetical protein